MLLGQARGKVGSLVFSRANGKQITRSLAEKVSNPRSDGQNVQRSIFATVNGFASAVRGIVDHSFQGVKEGNDSVNRFVSINTKKLREIYLSGAECDIMPKGTGLPYVNNYRMSQGSLGLQRLFISSFDTAKYFAVYEEQDWEGNVETPAMLQAMIPAFAPGCEIAVVKVYYNESEHYHYVKYDRAVFLSSFDGVEGSIISGTGISTNYLDMNKTTDNAILMVRGGNSGLKALTVSEAVPSSFDGGNDNIVACAVIVSQKDATTGKWIYTTSDMLCVEGYNVLHDITAAVNSYGNASAAESTSDLYLQQSATEQTDGTVSSMRDITYNVVMTGPIEVSESLEGSNNYSSVAEDGEIQTFKVNFPKEGNRILASTVKVQRAHNGVVSTNGVVITNKTTTGNTVVVEGVFMPLDGTLAGDSASIEISNASGDGVVISLDFTASQP